MTNDNMSNKRFGLRAMLVTVAVCACILGMLLRSYRVGEQSGYSRGFDAAMRQRLAEANLLEIEYAVDDVLRKAFPDDNPEFAIEDIVKLIAEKAKPETWDFVGGYGTLNISRTENSDYVIVVNNSISAHLEISRLLDDLRGAAPGIRDRSFVTKLYEAQTETANTE